MDPQHAVLHMLLVLQQQAIVDQRLIMMMMRNNRRRRRRKAFWVRPWLSADRRLQFGQYDTLMAEMRVEDTASFFNYLRMPAEMFDELVQRLIARLTKKNTTSDRLFLPRSSYAVLPMHPTKVAQDTTRSQ